jgi:16S rRNA (cytosine967-C5)-methyltransferase
MADMKRKKAASPKNRTEALARDCVDIAIRLMEVALVQKKPADRVLRALLRQRSSLRQEDRELISGTVFSLFRWWGWLAELAPESFQSELAAISGSESYQQVKPHSGPPELKRWSTLLLAAQYMEWDRPPWTARVFARHTLTDPKRLDRAWNSKPPVAPKKRMARIGSLLRNRPPAPEKWPTSVLIPAWAHSRITAPRPLSELIRWLQTPPPLWLRLQTRSEKRLLHELRRAGLDIRRRVSLGNTTAVAVSGQRSVYSLSAYQQGRIEVQDLASQCVGAACAPAEGQRWWDACAGGGGKTLLLADRMRGRGQVVASDVREYKLRDLRRRARRTGLHNISPRSWDGSSVDRRRSSFDGVLVDAPCSGSGTWRRNPDARWSAEPGEVDRLRELQLSILRRAAGAVGPGGVLVYATCSMFREENEDVAAAFLGEEDAFYLEPFTDPLSGDRTGGMLQIWPWTRDTDAMFVARMRRKPDPATIR